MGRTTTGRCARIAFACLFALIGADPTAANPAAGEPPGLTAESAAGQLAAIESRARALSSAVRPDAAALAELESRARRLADEAATALGAMREEAAERDADMAAVVTSAAWKSLEGLILQLRFRIAAIELDRAQAGGPDRLAHAREAERGFEAFVDAPDPELAAESRYGRGLARIAGGERTSGEADLREAATLPAVAVRARLALARSLAASGRRGEALALAEQQVAAGGASREQVLDAKLLALGLRVEALPARRRDGARQPGAAGPSRDAGGATARLAADLLAAGEPWRAAALERLRAHEDLLPAGPGADAAALRLRAEAIARSGDAPGALAAYREAVRRDPGHADPAVLAGLCRAAVATGEYRESADALQRLHASGAPWSRELALVELRTAHGIWQAAAGPETAAQMGAAAKAVAERGDSTAEDRAEAAFHAAEVARGAGDLDRAIAAFSAVGAGPWRGPARIAALQCRARRLARDPKSEPREVLLRDLEAAIADRATPVDARDAAIVLDATLRTAGGDPKEAGAASARDGERTALARVREITRRRTSAPALLASAVRAQAVLEVECADRPDPALLDAIPVAARPEAAAEIAGDLREIALHARDDSTARRALDGAIAFSARATGNRRSEGRMDLAERALALGDPRTALDLFRAASAERPASLAAMRGTALAAAAAGDPEAARVAWAGLAAMPDLPEALRAEAERARIEPVEKSAPARAVGGRVRGSASLPSPDALPAGAVFEATIEDVSRADAPASVLGRTRIESPGRSPIAFEIAWEPQRMAPGARVGLRGRVVLGDRLLFTTTTFQPLPTPGDDLRADLQLESALAPAPAATGQAGGEPGGATRPGL